MERVGESQQLRQHGARTSVLRSVRRCGRSVRDPAEELNAETGRYLRIREALDHPAMKVGSNCDAVQRLSDQLTRHEQNIKALHAEIRRTLPANDRGGGAAR
jgi:hypothetical protein